MENRESMYDLLLQMPLFQGITTQQLTRILEITPTDFRRFKAGEVISRGGEVCIGAIFILSGKVELQTPTFANRLRIMQQFGAPHNMSLHHLFGADVLSHSTIVATEDAGLMVIHKPDFLNLLQENQILLINAMNILCTRAQKQHKALDFSGESDPVLRIASWLLAFTDHSSQDICIEGRVEDWCEMLKLDEPSFWRCIAALEGIKALEVVEGRLHLTDRYELRKFINNKINTNG